MNKFFKEKEYQILKMVYLNMTNKQIAQNINLSVSSIKAYRKDIYKKLKAKNRLDAIVIALRMGLLDL